MGFIFTCRDFNSLLTCYVLSHFSQKTGSKHMFNTAMLGIVDNSNLNVIAKIKFFKFSAIDRFTDVRVVLYTLSKQLIRDSIIVNQSIA